MGKGLKITLGVLGVLAVFLIIGGFWFYSTFYAMGPLAVLSLEEGTTQYKAEDSWKDAKSGMELEQGYSVKTLEDSKAKIIFSDSVMRLDAETEIKLDELTQKSVSLTQSIGKTWSRILKISGISDYEVTTPNAVATVRGTAFSVDSEAEQTKIKVADGTVEVDSYKEKDDLEEDKEITIKKDDTDLEDKEEKLVTDEWVKDNLEEDEEHIEEIKKKYTEKYGTLFDKIIEQQGLSDEEGADLIDDWVDGKYSIQEEIEKGTIPEELVSIIPPELKRY
ncbi:FecR domain-containing protein [Nanoarchaeota archaeon]